MNTKTRRTADMNAVEGSFRFDGVLYERDTLHAAARAYAATIGLQLLISRSQKPAELYADLQAGSLKETKGAGPLYSDWHRAAAAAHALVSVKAAGVKAKGGKSLRDTDEFTAAYEAALGDMSPWSREKTNEARKHAAVVLEHQHLTGAAATSLDALFGKSEAQFVSYPAAEPEPEVQAEAA